MGVSPFHLEESHSNYYWEKARITKMNRTDRQLRSFCSVGVLRTAALLGMVKCHCSRALGSKCAPVQHGKCVLAAVVLDHGGESALHLRQV